MGAPAQCSSRNESHAHKAWNVSRPYIVAIAHWPCAMKGAAASLQVHDTAGQLSTLRCKYSDIISNQVCILYALCRKHIAITRQPLHSILTSFVWTKTASVSSLSASAPHSLTHGSPAATPEADRMLWTMPEVTCSAPQRAIALHTPSPRSLH